MKRKDFLKISILGLLASVLPATSYAKDKLLKVLILGDSISIGYFPFVKEMMKGKASVTRPFKGDGSAENCQGTTNGIINIDRWLGETKWDVVHFNFGLHDLKHIDPDTGKNSKNFKDPLQADIKQYKTNLIEIVGKLKATGAKLVFATTTPYPDELGAQIREPGMYKKYNKAALKIMKKKDVEVDDLNSFVLPQMDKLMRPNNVHFTEEGSKALAGQVVKSIQNLS